MARGVRLPRAAGRPPRFLRTGHRRVTSLNEAHLQAARRDAGHTLGRDAEGILQSLLFHRASRGLRAHRATFRVLAEGDPDVDAALASAVGCSPPPRSLTPPRPPLSDQRARAARRCGAAQIVRNRQRDRRRRGCCSHACYIRRMASSGRYELGREAPAGAVRAFRAKEGRNPITATMPSHERKRECSGRDRGTRCRVKVPDLDSIGPLRWRGRCLGCELQSRG